MLRYINYVAIIVFALAAIVQYNDVEAVRWMLVYGATSVISILFALNRLHWATATALALVCLIWALFIVPDLTLSGFQHMFDEVRMIQTGVEAAREFLGLLLITIWMTVLTLFNPKKSSRDDPEESGNPEALLRNTKDKY